jgi:hypothetical protein
VPVNKIKIYLAIGSLASRRKCLTEKSDSNLEIAASSAFSSFASAISDSGGS